MTRWSLFILTASVCQMQAQTKITEQPSAWPTTFQEDAIRKNPTYSQAILMKRDPRNWLQEMEAQIDQTPTPAKMLPLSQSAKAALEIGELAKAREYAIQSLALAEDQASALAKRGYREPRLMSGIPTVEYYSNFVLGRLAILNGDVRSAERYLIASGKTLGDPVLRTYGPNLSLAFELLKHGDAQSRQVVLTFIEEIKLFWNINPEHYRTWSTQIAAGQTPNFLLHGPNLFN